MDLVFGRRSVVVRIGPGESPGGADALAAQGTGAPGAGFVTALEKYELIGAIGQGGMGEVVLVHDRDLRREVAMKLIRPEYAASPDMQRMFVAEAQATSQLEHPGIPPVHDIGLTPDGKVYFTLKVVRGRTLAHLLKDLFLGATETRQVWNLHKLVSVLERVAEAVHFAHERAVIHRDLKPENVMLRVGTCLKVMDFGIAKMVGEIGLTTSNMFIGSPLYAAPEMVDAKSVDHRVDLYSLGIMLFEMLQGFPPFTGTSPVMVILAHRDRPLPALAGLPHPVSRPLWQLVEMLTSKDPAKRLPDARSTRIALEVIGRSV